MAAFVVGATLLPGAAASAADEPTPTPTPTSTEAPRVTAVPASSGVMKTGEALRVTIGVTATDTALPAGNAVLKVAAGALADAPAARSWIDGDGSIGESFDIATQPVAQVAAGANESTVITVAPSDPRLAALTPGTHAVEVVYSGGDAPTTTRTLVTVRAADAAPAVASVVVPITAPATTEGLLDALTLGELTSPSGSLTALVDAVSSTPNALLAIDPALIASIRALGSSAPLSAIDWLAALEALPNERFALQFADADVTTQFAAGRTEPLQPLSLSAYMLEANFTTAAGGVGPTPTPTTTPTADPTPTGAADTSVVPELPSTDELTAMTGAAKMWWPAQGAADATTLAAAGESGTTIIASQQVAGSPAAHVNAGGADVLAYDPELASTIAEAAKTVDAGDRGELIALISALIHFQSAAAGGAPVFTALDRGDGWTEDGVRAALGALTLGSGVQAVSASQLRDTPAVASTAAPAAPDATHVDALKGMLSDEKRITAFSDVLVSPDLLTGRERARVLRLLSAEWFSRPDQFREAMDAQHRRIAEILSAVSIVQPEKVTLVSSGSRIPMFVKNDLPFDVAVDIVARPDDPRVTVQERTEVVAARSSSTRTAVPVTAGISNGDVTIALELRAKNGELVDHTKYAQVSVRADWEAIGLVLLIGSGALLIGFGIFRTVRRRRQAKTSGVGGERVSRRANRDAFRHTHTSALDVTDGADGAGNEENRG